MQAAVYLLLYQYLNRNVKFEKLNRLPLGDDRKMFRLFQMELFYRFEVHCFDCIQCLTLVFIGGNLIASSIVVVDVQKWCSLQQKDNNGKSNNAQINNFRSF